MRFVSFDSRDNVNDNGYFRDGGEYNGLGFVEISKIFVMRAHLSLEPSHLADLNTVYIIHCTYMHKQCNTDPNILY